MDRHHTKLQHEEHLLVGRLSLLGSKPTRIHDQLGTPATRNTSVYLTVNDVPYTLI